jgi:hypothetical protein
LISHPKDVGIDLEENNVLEMMIDIAEKKEETRRRMSTMKMQSKEELEKLHTHIQHDDLEEDENQTPIE